MSEDFNVLRPEALGQLIIEQTHRLVKQATIQLENLYEPIRDFGRTPLKVFFFLYVTQTAASADEISRYTELPARSVRDGLKKCFERGYVDHEPAKIGMWRVTAKFRL